ncbi:porin family protein [Botryobacter ruber]|uniref:porin family protein n=1 Tax=Botryobacter ruber TaxID=2171629 RepID=UPI001F0C88F9|nr:porin family protein [Botryobacter ruber]
MKKIFLLLVVVMAVAATQVVAQQQPVRVGIRAGLNMANWQGESVESINNLFEFADGAIKQEMREGFHAGGFISIPVAPGFEIEPGLLYSQKGTRVVGTLPWKETEFLNVKATITNKAEYLELPVLAKIYVGEGFNLFAGPQVSYLLSNKIQARAGALGFNVLNREWDMKSGMREFDVALTGGLGYRFSSGLSISAGYDYGLTTVDSNRRFETYNGVIKGSVGFSF